MIRDALILAIDQGTTSTRAMIFDGFGQPIASAQKELDQHYPGDGLVEHEAEDIWSDTLAVCRRALAQVAVDKVLAVGITNQRETAVLWERASGRPLHRAIVWQDRRGAPLCQRLVAEGHEEMIRQRTGLVVDSYFSATKLAWLLDTLPGAREQAARGELCFGTVESFLVFRLTGGALHATDATNAARTMLFNIHTQDWDDDLLALFEVPRAVLPRVVDCAGRFADTEATFFGRPLPICGLAGDQHAAMIGQLCTEPGMVKCTFGTGAFILGNTGATPLSSRNRLLTTLAYRLAGTPTYALEGSIFNAGTAIKWLRDDLGVLREASESARLAAELPDNGGVYMVPAFTGLGAPWWEPGARGAILGLSRASGRAHLARAALESVAFQTADLLAAMADDGLPDPPGLRVDGGMAANDWMLGFLAGLLERPVSRPACIETTALGAALLAGLGAGLYHGLADMASAWRDSRTFQPRMEATRRRELLAGWREAVRRVLPAG
ncbi:glycerol kinase GlpK [Roseospirillum parvum]|uniref:glycerol kinase n=1 Tax=Roseospirillum parvum TaxID=83401 RepID=A0A1G8CT57_9PROT|nr:glycerol kinase GlpK [Roseospirillum parvum]SDH48672.1 glycerol kinase [Roseospirillum parvum]